MHVVELEYLIERELKEVVQEHFPLDWKEDAITHQFLIRLRKYFGNTTLHGLRYPLNIEWEIYKLHGPRETHHGDIGLLIRYRLPSGAVIEGAGFLEAKVRARESIKFRQVKHEQVNRILARSPQTRLLLYDHNAVTVLDSQEDFNPDWAIYHGPFLNHSSGFAQVTHGAVLPLELAAAINHYDVELYRFCHSFSYQFAHRYLHLHDLDFREVAIEAVKGFPRKLGPNIVLILRASVLGQDLPESFVPNENVYGRLE